MKKLLSTILLIILFFIGTKTVLAYDIIGPGGEGSSYKPNDDVIKMTLVSDVGSSSSSSKSSSSAGHTFLELENLAGISHKIGNLYIGMYDTITLGLFPNMNIGDYGNGCIAINKEGYNEKGRFENKAATLSMNIKLKDISDFALYVNQSNNYYNLFSHNCTDFATEIWNHFSFNKDISNEFITTPLGVYNAILSMGGNNGYQFQNESNYDVMINDKFYSAF